MEWTRDLLVATGPGILTELQGSSAISEPCQRGGRTKVEVLVL